MTVGIKNFTIVAGLTAVLLAITCAGAFAVSFERQQKRDISRQIAQHEREIKQLKIYNEELSVKIAEQENPARLSRRASTRLARPQMTAVVWAYENYEGGRVDFTHKSKGLVSFKEPSKKGAIKR